MATVIIVLPDRKTKACQGVSRLLLFDSSITTTTVTKKGIKHWLTMLRID